MTRSKARRKRLEDKIFKDCEKYEYELAEFILCYGDVVFQYMYTYFGGCNGHVHVYRAKMGNDSYSLWRGMSLKEFLSLYKVKGQASVETAVWRLFNDNYKHIERSVPPDGRSSTRER